MSSKFVTLETSQSSGWLKCIAPINISFMLVTLETSQSSGWLNCVPTQNPPFACKELLNVASMAVTLEVSQPEILTLKNSFPANRCDMSVISETSQWFIGPYVAVAVPEFSEYSDTAVARASFSVKLYGAGGGGDGGGGEGYGGGGEGDGGHKQQSHVHPLSEQLYQSIKEESNMLGKVDAASVTLEMSKPSGCMKKYAHLNICSMVVTLEVSKLTGWLNIVA